MKIKNVLTTAVACAVLGLTAGCGKKEGTDQPAPDAGAAPTAPATAEQQLANPEVFNRAVARARGLIQAKDYTQARQTLQQFDNVKLTPEQQRVLDQVKAQIPAN